MRILILGGVGFIGTNITKLALERGHKVVAFDNLERKGVKDNLSFLKTLPNFKFILGDIRNRSDFKKLPKRVEVIINLAANPSVPKSIKDPLYDFENNVVGHLNVLEFSRNNGKVPVVLASSNKVYTDKTNTYKLVEKSKRYEYKNSKLKKGLDESTDVDGFDGFTNSPYGVSKLAAEKYTREYWRHYNIPVVINRMSCIYGLFQKAVEDQGWVDWFLRSKKEGKPLRIFGNGKQVRDVLFSQDLAELYLEQIENIETFNRRTFNVGGGKADGFNVSLLELIELVDNNFPGKKLSYTFAPWRESDHKVYISNIDRLKKISKWRPTTKLIDGLKLMWKYY